MKPILQALLVADHVYTDAATGKKIVAGIFHTLRFAKRPPQPLEAGVGGDAPMAIPIGGLQAGSPFCYLSLTELRGRQAFTLRYVFLDEDKVIFSADVIVEQATPLDTVEAVLPLPTLPATQPGMYALELLWNDEPLGSHRINVIEIADPAGAEGGHGPSDA